MSDTASPIKKRKPEEEEDESSSEAEPETKAAKPSRSPLGQKIFDWARTFLEWLRKSTFLLNPDSQFESLWDQYVSEDLSDEELDELLPDLLHYARLHLAFLVDSDEFEELVAETKHQLEQVEEDDSRPEDEQIVYGLDDLCGDLDALVTAMNPRNQVKHERLKSLVTSVTASPEDWMTLLAEVQELSKIADVK